MHIIVLAMIFLLTYVFNTWDEKGVTSSVDPYRSINTVTNFLWIGLFYLNAYVLIPRLFYKRKYLQYALVLIASFYIIMLLHGALFKPFVTGRTFNFMSSSVHNTNVVLCRTLECCKCVGTRQALLQSWQLGFVFVCIANVPDLVLR